MVGRGVEGRGVEEVLNQKRISLSELVTMQQISYNSKTGGFYTSRLTVDAMNSTFFATSMIHYCTTLIVYVIRRLVIKNKV